MSRSNVTYPSIPEMFLDPHTPAFFDDKLDTWNFFSHRDVVTVLTDHENFSMMYGDPDVHPTYGAMWFSDPPRHTDLRALIADRFQSHVVAHMVFRIEQIANDLLNPIISTGRFEVVRTLAEPLPTMVMCDVLGVDYSESTRFVSWMREEHELMSLGQFPHKPEMVQCLKDR